MGLIYSDIPELNGTDTEIALANLSFLETEISPTFEKRIGHICELARAIIHDGGDLDIIKSIILSIRSDGEFDFDGICPDNTFELKSLFTGISHIERLIIFKQIFKMIPHEKYFKTDNATLNPIESMGKVSYVQNSYNDIAFKHLSSLIDTAKASYCNNFTEACETVINNQCQFCILPVETMKDGKLTSFYNAIIKYDLRIYAEYDLEYIDGEGYTRYALLGDSKYPSKPLKVKKNQCKYVEIAYWDTENISLSELFVSAEFFGLKLQKIDTLSVSKEGKKNMFCSVFKATSTDIYTFLTYLSIDCPDCFLIGIYQRL